MQICDKKYYSNLNITFSPTNTMVRCTIYIGFSTRIKQVGHILNEDIEYRSRKENVGSEVSFLIDCNWTIITCC